MSNRKNFTSTEDFREDQPERHIGEGIEKAGEHLGNGIAWAGLWIGVGIAGAIILPWLGIKP